MGSRRLTSWRTRPTGRHRAVGAAQRPAGLGRGGQARHGEGVPGFADWLCPTSVDRMRYLDMQTRMRVGSLIMACTLIPVALISARWFDSRYTVLTALASLLTVSVLVVHQRRHGIVTTALGLAGLELLLVSAVAVTGGAHSPVLPAICLPMILIATWFRRTVVACAVAVSLTLTTTVVVSASFWPVPAVPWYGHFLWQGATTAGVLSATLSMLEADLSSRDQATSDALTGLWNRTALELNFPQIAALAARTRTPLSLILCDLDHFKVVNDSYGHGKGDDVLRAVARVLERQVGDIGPVFRIGGEEFLIVDAEHSADEVAAMAQSLVDAVAATPAGGVPVTVSVGTATSPDGQLGFDDLFARADSAMYRAKTRGRNRAMAYLG